jgi:hypothetical protein
MSLKEPIHVQTVVLTESPDGTRLLSISSKTGPLELEFSAEVWKRLSESARWFYSNSVRTLR